MSRPDPNPCGSACLILGVVLLCACGTPPPPAPVKLTLFGLGLEAGELLRQDALDEFTRTTGIQVELIPTVGNSTQQLTAVLDLLKRHASSPDIYLIDTIWPGTLHEFMEDLTPYLQEESRTHLPVLMANNTVAGRIVALPFYMNSGMLYYRADLLKTYGYSAPPATWADLTSAALRIQQGERRRGKRTFWGYVWQGAPYEGLTCNALEWQVSFGGGNLIGKDGTVTVNNLRTVRALRTAARWVGSISPPAVLAYTESDTLNAFRSGGAAFMRNWSSSYRSVTRDAEPQRVGVSFLPAGPGGRANVIGGFQLAMSRYSRHKQQAAQLILYLTSKAVQRRRALRRGILPTYPDIHQEADFLKAVPPGWILRDLPPDSWVLRPSSVADGQYANVSKAYFTCVHGVLSGQLRAQPALAELETSLQHLMSLRQSSIGR